MIYSIPLFLLITKMLLLLFGLKNSFSNLFLFFFLLSINLYFTTHLYWVVSKDIEVSLILVNHFTPLYLLTGPFLYFYVKSIVSGAYVFQKQDLLHTIPFFIQLIAISGYVFLPVKEKEMMLKTLLENPQDALNLKFNFIFSTAGNFIVRFISAIVYSVLSIRFLLAKKAIVRYYPITNTWLWSIVISFFVLVSSYGLMINSIYSNPENFYTALGSKLSILALVSIMAIALLPLFFPHIVYGVVKLNSNESTMLKSAPIETLPNDTMISLSKQIVAYFEGHQPYLEKKFTLPQLAAEMKVPVHHIQKCFKEVHKTSFVNFKTKYKVEWAISALKDPAFKNETIDAIGSYAGFNSKSQFYISFKKHKKMTPKQYLKKHH